MAVKMKALVVVARIFCVVNVLTGLTVFGVSFFPPYSETRQISVPVIDDLRVLHTESVCLAGIVVVFSSISYWFAPNYKKKDVLVVVFILLFNFTGFFVGIYFIIEGSGLTDRKPLDKETLFNLTNSTISEGIKTSGDLMWIPRWLEMIQEESTTCCGIQTFNDYDEFWNPIKKHVPKSCCRIGKAICHTELTGIPFPDTVANNIKVNEGCYEEIKRKITQVLCLALTLVIIMTVSLALSALAFSVEYSCAYFKSKSEQDDQTSGPLFLTEEQTWATLDFFPVRNNNNDPQPQQQDNDLSDVPGGPAGEILDTQNKMTNTDNSGQGQDLNQSNPFKNQVQQTAPLPQQTQFIPEVNLLSEFGSDIQLPAAQSFLNSSEAEDFEPQQQQIPDEYFTRNRMQSRNFDRKKRRRHREQ